GAGREGASFGKGDEAHRDLRSSGTFHRSASKIGEAARAVKRERSIVERRAESQIFGRKR
ncbi:MAG: hypothetical protein D6812_03620, partial [Deltaproteobacteria bacterium]